MVGNVQWTSWYPSSVNRGYFSYGKVISGYFQTTFGIHPLSIEAISPTPTKVAETHPPTSTYPSSVNRGYFSYPAAHGLEYGEDECIHPLSIEAISPTRSVVTPDDLYHSVSILCQSRLFLLLLHPK